MSSPIHFADRALGSLVAFAGGSLKPSERIAVTRSLLVPLNRGLFIRLDAIRLMEVVNLLAADAPLPRRNFDHALSGEWSDHRDCHVKPDLVLIYRKPDHRLELVRLGSHGELGM